jgi:hypothetical protein
MFRRQEAIDIGLNLFEFGFGMRMIKNSLHVLGNAFVRRMLLKVISSQFKKFFGIFRIRE